MYTLCSTEESAAQQRRFEEALLPLLLEQPYDSIRISELCRRAGFSRKVFYRLFEQKADVLYAMVDHTLLDFEHYQPDIPMCGDGGVHRFFGYWMEKKDLLDALIASQCSSLLTERAIRHVLSEDSYVRKTFGADSGSYGRETIVFFLSGLFSLVLDWHGSGYQRSIDEMSGLVMRLLTTPPVKCPLPNQIP